MLHDKSRGTQVFAYRNDGEYSIDNLAAERAIRPQTIQRKGSLFFGSVQGEKFAQMNNEGLVSVNTSNRKITINFTLVNSAINSVFALCKAIDQDLER